LRPKTQAGAALFFKVCGSSITVAFGFAEQPTAKLSRVFNRRLVPHGGGYKCLENLAPLFDFLPDEI
jgi:hypothetical protein